MRPWDDQSNTMENAKNRMRAAFEFMSKLGIRHYTFHDVYVLCCQLLSSHIFYACLILILEIYSAFVILRCSCVVDVKRAS